LSYLETLFNLNDKVVLVTGACGQLGKVICKAFKDSGCKVIGIDIDIK
jgi:NAD(P)-dependent dehydrogenase (short-subunit alcohol dehydrogenase family)